MAFLRPTYPTPPEKLVGILSRSYGRWSYIVYTLALLHPNCPPEPLLLLATHSKEGAELAGKIASLKENFQELVA